MAEQLADKRLAELEANMDTKRETANTEIVKQLKSIMKEEIATLKSKVHDNYNKCFVSSSSVVGFPALSEIFT